MQHINICNKLEKTDNDFIQATRDLLKEKRLCLKKLDLPDDGFKNMTSVKSIRTFLQNREFDNWSTKSYKGRGAILFKEFPPANNFVDNKGLSASELKDAIKIIGDVAPVRVLPGRSKDGTQCRHCSDAENFSPETLPHVLGFCPFGELLRNHRHHSVRSLIAEALRERGLTVFEEVACTADSGSIRRVDILAIDKKKNVGWIIDPTVRFELNQDQPNSVNSEKQRIYEPTTTFFKMSYGLKEVKVIGLLIGARGTITSLFRDFCISFGIPSKLLKIIALSVLKQSIYILRNHLYNK